MKTIMKQWALMSALLAIACAEARVADSGTETVRARSYSGKKEIYYDQAPQAKRSTKSTTAGTVKHLAHEAALNEHLAKAGNATTILFIHKRSCPHCAEVWPVFNKLAAQHGGRANFVAIDVEQPQNAGVFDRYISLAPYNLKATPYFVAFRGSQAVAGSLPGIPREDVEGFVMKHVSSSR